MAEDEELLSEEDAPYAALGMAVEIITAYVDQNPELESMEFHGTVEGKAIVRSIIVKAIDLDE